MRWRFLGSPFNTCAQIGGILGRTSMSRAEGECKNWPDYSTMIKVIPYVKGNSPIF